MHPQRVFLADICNVTERIKGSIHCGTSCCIDVKWNQTLPCRSCCKFTIIQLTEADWFCLGLKCLIFFLFANHQRRLLRKKKTFTFFLAKTMAASSSAEIILPLQTGNIHTSVWGTFIICLHLTWSSNFWNMENKKGKDCSTAKLNCRCNVVILLYKSLSYQQLIEIHYWTNKDRILLYLLCINAFHLFPQTHKTHTPEQIRHCLALQFLWHYFCWLGEKEDH